MPTATEALLIAAGSLDAATQSVLQTRAAVQADIALGKTETTKIVSDAITRLKSWWVDPINGNDANDGSMWTRSKKTLHSVIGLAQPSTDHFVYLMNDLEQVDLSALFANMTIRGSAVAADPTGIFPHAATKRRITFKPTAVQSPIGVSTTVCGCIQVNHNLSLSKIDLVLADQPAGQNIDGHLYMFNNTAISHDGDILGVTPGAPGRLIQKGDAAPIKYYHYGTISQAAKGRIFPGVAAGADPRVYFDYQTNISAA